MASSMTEYQGAFDVAISSLHSGTGDSGEREMEDTLSQLPSVEWIRLSPGWHRASPYAADNQSPGSSILLTPSPLIRSVSAPPDYIPSLPASRQHRAIRQSVWPIIDDDRFRPYPLPPEVVTTRRREKDCSECCLKCIVVLTTLRWLFVSVALLGAGCVIAGIVFGVMSSTLDKNTFFVLAFTFIGFGIVLVLAVGIGWRCTPAGHEPCHALCNLSQTPSDGGFATPDMGSTRIPRLMQRSRNQWYGGFLYPEFRYGTPPPSYSAAMQQNRHFVEIQMEGTTGNSIRGNSSSISSLDNLSSLPSSPPPTYHSRVSVRSRPPIPNGTTTLSTAIPVPDDLPPPYRSSSRGSSLDGLDVVDEGEVVNSEAAHATLPRESRETIVVSSSPEVAEAYEVAVEAPGVAEEPGVVEAPGVTGAPVATDNLPEMECVRSKVQRFEGLSRLVGHRPTTTGQLFGMSGRPSTSSGQFPGSSSQPEDILSVDISVKSNGAHPHSGGQLFPELNCKRMTESDQSQSINTIDYSDSPVLDRALLTPLNEVQLDERETTSVGGSCSSNQSHVTSPDNDQLHSVSARSRNINSVSTNELSQGVITPNVNDFSLANHTVASGRSSNFRNQSQDALLISDQSSQSRINFDLLQAVNHASSRRNPSYKDFCRNQSLDDHEIGESGI